MKFSFLDKIVIYEIHYKVCYFDENNCVMFPLASLENHLLPFCAQKRHFRNSPCPGHFLFKIASGERVKKNQKKQLSVNIR